MTLHVEFTRYSQIVLRRHPCIGCDRNSFFVDSFQEWYGWNGTCLKCGEQYSDEEWLPRPFARAWRQRNIEHAREHWRRWKSPALEPSD